MTAVSKFDFKKADKELYQPKASPGLIQVPEMTFIMIDGKGDPNDPAGQYPQALALLYALSWTIRMSKMGGEPPAGYFDYVVAPLEGLWWLEGGERLDFTRKDRFCWTALIRQPDFVTKDIFAWAGEQVRQKKGLDPGCARLKSFREGLCVQAIHYGSYDEEPGTLARMEEFILANGLRSDLSAHRRHHEIYFNDPRKTAPEKRRTLLRLPARREKERQ